jgi:hypothetical protein
VDPAGHDSLPDAREWSRDRGPVVVALRAGDDRRKFAGGVVNIVNLTRQSTFTKSAIYNPQARN